MAFKLELDPGDKRCGFCQLRDLRREAKKHGHRVWVRFAEGLRPDAFVYPPEASLDRIRKDPEYAFTYAAGTFPDQIPATCRCEPEGTDALRPGDLVRVSTTWEVESADDVRVTVHAMTDRRCSFTVMRDQVRKVKRTG